MKTKILLCLMVLMTLAAPAQYHLKEIPSLQDKLNPHHLKITEKVVKNEATNPLATRAQNVRAEQPTHQVNFILDFDTETQDAYNVVLVNENGVLYYYNIDLWDLELGSNTATIPEGTYDILFQFAEWQNKGTDYIDIHHWLYVIREQVTIDQDMELNFSSAEAKNHIHFQTLTIDGEPIVTPTYSRDKNWNYTLLDLGNIRDAVFLSLIFCKDYGDVYQDGGGLGMTIEVGGYHLDDYQCLADFYVNDVSDRYAFGSYRVTQDWDNNFYTSYKEVQGASGDVTIANDPSKFKLYENQFSLSQDDLNRFSIFLLNNKNTKYYYQVGWWLGSMPNTIKYYISASTEDSEVGYIPCLRPETYLYEAFVDEDGYEDQMDRNVITAIPIVMTDETFVLANSGLDLCENQHFAPVTKLYREWDESEQTVKCYPLWPSHPVFSYPVDKKKGIWGNNCPILISSPQQYERSYTYEDEDDNPVTVTRVTNQFCYQYLGRYGEVPGRYCKNAQVSMNLDGEPIYNGPGFFEEGYDERPLRFDELFNGVVDAAITTAPFQVDDTPGSNKAQLHYTAGAEDETPPTMMMLHFKDDNGDVTDRFTTAEDGTVEFSAADFNFAYIEGNMTYFRHAPVIVEVSYSPYGEDNWNELTVEELPEYYYPAMGWFYRGSLASVTVQGLEGWFDLKIRLEDAAGNWQEQVLSPAFRIDNLAYSSVATVGSNNAHEVARYSLDGKRVDSNATGVVIVKMSDGTARKVLK